MTHPRNWRLSPKRKAKAAKAIAGQPTWLKTAAIGYKARPPKEPGKFGAASRAVRIDPKTGERTKI